jgi:ABC-type dipeptide/oligopeptide/nickel transport system ATPase component
MSLRDQIKTARRHQVKVRVCLYGASGSGKSGTAFRLAHYLSGGTDTTAGNFLVIDTENNSAILYAVAEGESINPSKFRFEFQHLNLGPSQTTPASYVEAMNIASELGVGAVVIDSATHEWQNILDRKTTKDAQGGNSFTNWGPFTKEHQDFVEAIKNPPCHLIVTTRAKEEFVVEKNDAGKTVIRKMGTQPIQRDGFNYELDINILMQSDDAGVSGTVIKTRNPDLLNKVILNPGKDLAEQLAIWSQTGDEPPLTKDAMIHRLVREGHYSTEEAVVDMVKSLKIKKPEGVDGYTEMYNTLKLASNVIE